MGKRIEDVYTSLFQDSTFCTKEAFANKFDITTKSVENIFKKYSDDIIYDKKLKRYRFISLLPKYIPYKVFYNIFRKSIANKYIRDDFFIITKQIEVSNDAFMLRTDKLSNMVKNIICFTIAINDNCIIKVNYKGNNKKVETKYIQPNTILQNIFSYFSYVTYDKLNKSNTGESRTFKFTNIVGNIEPIKYVSDTIFKQDKKGNVFGERNNSKYVTLIFNKVSGDFFEDNNIFNNGSYEVVVGRKTNNIIVKMYFNSLKIEVVKTIQEWMPNIKVHDDDPLKKDIYEQIAKNYKDLASLLQ